MKIIPKPLMKFALKKKKKRKPAAEFFAGAALLAGAGAVDAEAKYRLPDEALALVLLVGGGCFAV